MENPARLALLFDGSCDFCTACTELLWFLDRRHRLLCLPFQAPGVPQSYGLTIAQCEQAVWVITSRGQKYQGAQAISAALDSIIGRSFFSWLYRLPGIKQIENSVYAWVAKNRRFFPGVRPYCERPNALCNQQ